VSRGLHQITTHVSIPTARVSGCASEGLAATRESGTLRGTPSIALSWDTKINTATAFWNPAITGDGM
jgi:hypothetical protein